VPLRPLRILSLAVLIGGATAGIVLVTSRPPAALVAAHQPEELPAKLLEPISPPPPPPELPDFSSCAVVSLDEAKHYIVSSEVALVSQPHEGEVAMLLRSGSTVCFTQPRLDWVMSFARANGHGKSIVFVVE
jgi:hypothetical protein